MADDGPIYHFVIETVFDCNAEMTYLYISRGWA